MSSLLESIVSNNDMFAETLEGSVFEGADFEARPYYLRSRRKGGLTPKHKIIRSSNYKGLGLHTKSEHRSHGYNSFCRTHSHHPTCRRR